MSLEFLSKATLADVAKTTKAATKRSLNPEDAHLRLFRSGAVYPSLQLIAKFDLEYRAKDAEEVGYAFDVFKSKDFPMWKSDYPDVILITAVSKDAARVDLFGSVGYNTEGEPLSSVASQGASTFGKELITMLMDIHNLTENGLFAGEKFIDLNIDLEHPVPAREDGIYFIPKTISRGKRKGQKDLERRENVTIYGMELAGGVPAKGEEVPEMDEEPEVEETDVDTNEVTEADDNQ